MELLIGHFGIMGPVKRPELLIEVATIIARTHRVKLLFTGFGVNDAIRAAIRN